MTGGTIVVLGNTGRNFAAGMSGGVAYVFDDEGTFASKCNCAQVELDHVLSAQDQELHIDKTLWHKDGADETVLKTLIERHFELTASARARFILDHWVVTRNKFFKVFPTEYKRALTAIAEKTKCSAI